MLYLFAGLLPAMWVPNAAAQWFTNIMTPVFQNGAFFNIDMDLSPGQAMTMNGKVHCNGTIWMYPQASMIFNDAVEATLVVTNQDNPSDQQNLTFFVPPTYATLPGGVPNPFSGAAPLFFPPINSNIGPANAEAILNLPPVALAAPNGAAYATSNQLYVYNECDLIVSNAFFATNATIGTNFVIYFQDKFNTPILAKLTNEVFTFSNKVSPYTVYTTNSPYAWNANYVKIAAGFWWLTNVTFYDYREQDAVKAVQIDVGLFNIWLTNRAFQGYKFNQLCRTDNGHPIISIYVYNSIPSLSGSPGQLPAVRVVNGSQLPSSSGLTIATPFPLYVLGNYNIQTNGGSPLSQQSHMTNNTTWTRPAALMGDSVTVLSSYWQDSYTNTTALLSRIPTNTTVNAACLGGIIPSITVAGAKHYSGGLENFLRMLEDWGGICTLCYNGSIVAMFPSIYATNFWQGPGNYYNPPTRKWGFDANFVVHGKLPPLTPYIVNTNLPVIILQPTNQTVLPGSTTTFSVTAFSYTSLVYQWSFNGTNLNGATNTSLTLTNVQASQAGNYAVLVTNVFGSVLSSNAVLTVTATPTIQTQPTNQTVLVSSNVTISVTATGTSPLSYQWSFDGTNLAGATNASLPLANASTTNAGSYLVVITNLYGSVTSSVATLTVVFPPSITVQPASQVAMSGSNITLGVTITGTGPFTYQWQLNGTNLTNNIITTVAGNGTNGYSGDGGVATSAMLSSPAGLAVDAAGSLYLADYYNNRIRKVDANGIITTMAGNGSASFSGDGGAATNASLYCPNSVTVDAAGNLYIADLYNNRIRKVDTNGIITTVAGNGALSFSGDGGAATNASFIGATSVILDPAGNLYIADCYNNRIRKVDTNGIITTVAGNGSTIYSGDGGVATNASLSNPNGLAVDVAGNLYIADCHNNRIRKVDSNGIITTVAGNGSASYSGDGGAATNASLSNPFSVAVDIAGNLYIADSDNYRVRRVNTNGIITTVAGNGIQGYSGDGSAAANARLAAFCYVAVDAAGNLFIDDLVNQRTRLVTFTGPTLTLNNVSAAEAGNYSLVVTSPYGSVTSSNAVLSVYATMAATLNGCSFSCANGIQFQVAGVPGFDYAVQESTNLIDWISLITNTAPFSFADANATNSPLQFYRAIRVP